MEGKGGKRRRKRRGRKGRRDKVRRQGRKGVVRMISCVCAFVCLSVCLRLSVRDIKGKRLELSSYTKFLAGSMH